MRAKRKGEYMFKRVIMIGLLGISVVALLGTEASAKVCLLYQGGSCVFWSGSVECDLNANALGNITKDPKYFGCNANSQGAGLLLCGNPGSNQNAAPGIQIVTVPESFGAFTGIDKIGRAHV